LRFTVQELHKLAHLQGFTALSLQEAEYLTRDFDGWIAGILLSSSLGYTQMQPQAPSHREKWGTLASLADRQHLSAYIDGEVYRQERATYEFLQATSILDYLTPRYCNEFLEITDAAERLVYAEQQGLFVTRSEEHREGGEAGTYIYHPILRKLCREKLRLQEFERYRELQRRAASLFHKDRKYEQALLHALEAQEYTLAVNILIPLASGLVDQGEEEVVASWLDLFPASLQEQNPWLLLLRVTIYLARNEYTQVPALLASVEAGSEKMSDIHLSTKVRLARSKWLFYRGEFRAAQELCQQVLEALPVDEDDLRIKAYQRLGVCCIVGNGRISEGIVYLQQALQLNNSQKKESQAATLHRLLANAYGWIGNYTLANYHQTRALQIWEKLDKPRGIIHSLTSLGLLNLRQGLTGPAEEMLTRALHLARDVYHFTNGEAYALVALGELHCTLAHYIQSLTYLEEGLRLARQCDDHYLIHCTLCSLATTYLFIGEIQTSQFLLQQITLEKQEEQSYEGLLYHVTRAMLFLAQQTYEQVWQALDQAVKLGKYTGIQFLYVQALLLQVLFHDRQQQVQEAFQIIGQVLELNKKGDFDYMLELMSRRYPELQKLLQRNLSEPLAQLTPQDSQLSGLAPADPVLQFPERALGKLSIMAFGEPKVLIDSTAITHWHLTRSLELFFFLLEKTHSVKMDQIIDALWPNTTSEQIETTVRTAIYYLRKAIGKACVVYHVGLYSLNLSAVYNKAIWYDVALFEEQYAKGKKALEDEDEETASLAFTEVVKLYQGDYAQSFYSNRCITRREQLRSVYMDAHQQLALIAWHHERWEDSLQHWRHLLALDPCLEKAHHGIMRCYLRQGNRELALRQYQRCLQSLQEELQAVPGPSIQKLYQRVLQITDQGHKSIDSRQ
jgi:DNA-binding SARP family transcriptional activator